MRAFIFSLDAFVAFTIALIAIYSLIFFSSVPSAYYYMLTQAHYLARDGLLAMSTTSCQVSGCINPGGTVLDNIAFHKDDAQQRELIRNTVGLMVPLQFGYKVSVSDDSGHGWKVIYDTSAEPDGHAKAAHKLTVSTQVMTFGHSETTKKLHASPYSYGGFCAAGNGDAEAVDGGAYYGTLITCGEMEFDDGEGNIITKALGNIHPSAVLAGDLVPASDARIVKLTIFI